MSDQRLTVRLVKMWDKLAELTPPPMFAQLNQSAISDIWQQCAVLHVEPSTSAQDIHLMCDYIGDKAKALVPEQLIGRSISSKTLDRNMKKYLKQMDQVICNKVTIINQGTLVNDRSKVVKYRTCLLPFTDSNADVTHIMVGFSWIEC